VSSLALFGTNSSSSSMRPATAQALRWRASRVVAATRGVNLQGGDAVQRPLRVERARLEASRTGGGDSPALQRGGRARSSEQPPNARCSPAPGWACNA
jgi:hypothetical protein